MLVLELKLGGLVTHGAVTIASARGLVEGLESSPDDVLTCVAHMKHASHGRLVRHVVTLEWDRPQGQYRVTRCVPKK